MTMRNCCLKMRTFCNFSTIPTSCAVSDTHQPVLLVLEDITGFVSLIYFFDIFQLFNNSLVIRNVSLIFIELSFHTHLTHYGKVITAVKKSKCVSILQAQLRIFISTNTLTGKKNRKLITCWIFSFCSCYCACM